MQDPDTFAASPFPFVGRWHVIDEIDLVGLVADHAATERLCARLEACADQLPDRPTLAEIDDLCAALQSRILDHIEREDQLLAAMFARTRSAPLCHALLDQIHMRHVACTVLAQDLVAALDATAPGHRTICAEALGYMLRCFFEGCRAAMAFEELAILALAGSRLTREARALLTERLAAA
ncbi:hemerythrin domain-containing protein [Sphingomonas sp. NFR15]|uniref:hemerythrin domain-containing protein n=1 Tax=Sphingomonas sp. NFR15 TaxID=1566282 RepID=UPI0008899ABD|nr:hemerythrin domain-containing protein [Sphingomonas sp. NFR15]SDA30163.1 Hemerythrin HHE cation binding domain-containing protein [Sphingomonas sp. NFR15]